MGKASAAGRQVRKTAREKLGLDRLRPGQGAAVEAVLAGRDALVVMPTGWGKSAIYQIAGAQLGSPTVIVSPLIALQNDQAESLAALDLGRAEVLNSQLANGARGALLEAFAAGAVQYLFLAPEQLQNEEVMAALRQGEPGLFVVDEAHCLCEWGHDFRPDYLRLEEAVEKLGRPTVLAMTATAAPPVRREIQERLGMRQPFELVLGFDRPNIFLEVHRFESEEAQIESLLEAVASAEGPGIVYAATRKSCEEAAASLPERGIMAGCYHAGMSRSAREAAQAAWMNGETPVIVATTAFGMGIDKPDVRWVFHLHVAESLDAYYQEIGRAGRDGEPARATLFYRAADLNLRRFFASGANFTSDELEPVVQAMAEAPRAVDADEVKEEVDLPDSKVEAAVRLLEQSGVVERDEESRYQLADDPEATVRQALEAQEKTRRFDQSRVEMMQAYAETAICRREFVLSYFGEEFHGPCGCCDNCTREAAADTPVGSRESSGSPDCAELAEEFPVGSEVHHAQWARGQVLRYEGDKVIVLFDDAGYKTLDCRLAREKRLLYARR